MQGALALLRSTIVRELERRGREERKEEKEKEGREMKEGRE